MNANKSYLIDIDSGGNLLRQTGYLTTQVGDVGGTTFDNAALGTTTTEPRDGVPVLPTPEVRHDA